MRRNKTVRLLTQGLGVLALSVCLSTGSVLAADDTSGTGSSPHSGSTKSVQTSPTHQKTHHQHHHAHQKTHHPKQKTTTTNPS